MEKLCECGCGNSTSLASKTDKSTNRIEGVPMRFIRGHNTRIRPVKFTPKYGKDNPSWRGDNVQYRALHDWISRHKNKTRVCEHCKKESKTHWANIDGAYKRNLNDFIELCPSCHKIYDIYIINS